MLSLANIGTAFFTQWYVLTQLGPGMKTDALFAGMTVPQLVLTVISGSLMHVLVPLLAGEDEDRLRHDAWGFVVLIGGLFSFLAIILYVTTQWWVPLTVPGFDEAGKALTVQLTNIQLIGMVCAAVNGVQWATYHARQHFVWAEFTPVLASVFALLLLVWSLPRYGVIAAAWASTVRMALQTLFLAPGLGKPVWPDMRRPAISDAWQRIKPLLLGTAYYKTDPLVDRFLLSMAGSGSLSLYCLAQQIYGAVSQVMNRAMVAPLVPLLSNLNKAGDLQGFRRAYRQKLFRVGLFSLAGLLTLGLAGQFVLNLFIGHGHVSAANVDELWWIMIWLAGVFVGGAAGQISSSAFYALGDTKTPTRVGVYTYSLYMPSKIAMFYFFGTFGLALAASVFFLGNFLLQNRLLRKGCF